MTSSSSHHLRSAVSACAQPTHSYINPSCFGASLGSGSHDSGGCYKKFISNSDKSIESPFSTKLSITKKPNLNGNDCSFTNRKSKGISNRNAFNCGFPGGKLQNNNNDKLKNVNNIDCIGKKIVHEINNTVLNGLPKNLKLANGLLSKHKQNGNVLDNNNKKFINYLSEIEASRNKLINITRPNFNKKLVDNLNNNCNINNNNNNNNNSHDHHKTNSDNVNNNSVNDVDSYKNSNNNNIRTYKKVEECSKCEPMHLDEEDRGNDKVDILKWQPKHTLTRRTAQISREVYAVWQARVGTSSFIPAEKVQLLFNDLQLYPPESQVYEMLECAKECAGRPSPSFLTFGEFCVFATELKKCCDRGISRPPQLSRLLEKDGEELPNRRTRKLSKSMCKSEVFLGGSCNPTTWRTDIAIPMLNNMGITFYNPQVSQWRPELLEAEYYAKENATVMFFVMDNQTRGVSALIEVAHLAGCRRKLILVIQSYTQQKQSICGEVISQEEYEDLKNGQEVLQDLVERQGIPVFDNITVALQCTQKVLRENITVQELGHNDLVGDKLINLREAFDAFDTTDCGELSLTDACLAFKILTNREISINDVRNIASQSGMDVNDIHLENVRLNFEQFRALVAEFKNYQENGALPIRSQVPLTSKKATYVRDVYLAGTCKDTSWRETIAIPHLIKNNLTFFNHKVCEWSERILPIEAAAMENSFVLLFVITNTARSVAAMAVAGHYIGLGCNVVLCVQQLPENAVIGSEKLSPIAIKDYNRGRMYLADIAKRSGVPVFSNISEAVECVIEKCKDR